MKEIDREFISFLKRNNCFDEYKENFINLSSYRKFREFLYVEPRKRYISMAFLWRDTPQGYDYWGDIFEKWNDKCNNYGY